MIDVGSLDGCRTSGVYNCSNNWSMSQLFQVAWGLWWDYPLPEIHLTDGTQAYQWANLASQEGYIGFLGPLTECAQGDPIPSWGQPCYDNHGILTNGDTQAWQQLWNDYSHAHSGNLRFLTNIRWGY